MCWDNDATMRGFEKRIKKLKSRYAGETCFVIGNGPSLKLSDLEQLRQSYTFGVNKIYDLYTMTEWRPTFYVLQDFKLMQAIFSEAEQATRASRLRFFNMRMLEQSPFNMPPPLMICILGSSINGRKIPSELRLPFRRIFLFALMKAIPSFIPFYSWRFTWAFRGSFC